MPDEPRPISGPELQTYLAAERTILAWFRTGLAVMGLGFVVARFGLFLRVSAASLGSSALPKADAHSHVSTAIGVALIALAIVMTIGGAAQYKQYLGSVSPGANPPRYSVLLVFLSACSLAVIGAFLAFSIVVWTY